MFSFKLKHHKTITLTPSWGNEATVLTILNRRESVLATVTLTPDELIELNGAIAELLSREAKVTIKW